METGKWEKWSVGGLSFRWGGEKWSVGGLSFRWGVLTGDWGWLLLHGVAKMGAR